MKTERLYIRVSPANKRLLTKAAKIKRITLTAFVELAAIQQAESVTQPVMK